MKISLLLTGLCLAAIVSGCGPKPTAMATANLESTAVLETACGQCLLGLKEKQGCDLAVRIEGKSYFVDGIKMSDYGDAHADDGMCSIVRKGKVTGRPHFRRQIRRLDHRVVAR